MNESSEGRTSRASGLCGSLCVCLLMRECISRNPAQIQVDRLCGVAHAASHPLTHSALDWHGKGLCVDRPFGLGDAAPRPLAWLTMYAKQSPSPMCPRKPLSDCFSHPSAVAGFACDPFCVPFTCASPPPSFPPFGSLLSSPLPLHFLAFCHPEWGMR